MSPIDQFCVMRKNKGINMPKKPKKQCGLIMPISSIDGCSAEHWIEVKSIITEAINLIGDFDFSVSLVSDADEIGVIQKRIVQNIYSSDVVVCDVSGKNPNVMFELGMRLAFDKPTVIVKDDKTDYSFDTGIIEHVTYPRDLRFTKIVAFKEKLADKISATLHKAEEDPEHSTFLKNFGKFQVANLSEDIVSSDKIILSMLSEMQSEIGYIRSRVTHSPVKLPSGPPFSFKIRQVARSWAKKQECDISSLIDNEDFYDYAEKRIDAPTYFDSKKEFIEAANIQLEDLIA